MATLTSSTVNMMFNDDWQFVCGKTGHIGCHCPDAQCYKSVEFGHFTQDCPSKISSSGTPPTTTGHFPGHITTTAIETDHSSQTTGAAMEDVSTSHNYTTDPTMTIALATTKDIHPALHPTITAVCAILCLT